MTGFYYIENSNLNTLINFLKERYKVFAPILKESSSKGNQKDDYRYSEVKGSYSLVLNPYRTIEPLKSFFTYSQEKVSDYFTPEECEREFPQTIIFGVKSCDLLGHKIQDFVFLEGVEVDSLYRQRRENIILISSDCTDFKEVCHCLAWDILPHPVAGFDLNLSPLSEGYLVEVGSKKGEGFLRKHKEYFIAARDSQVYGRKIKRENFIERLKKHLLPQNLVSKDNVQKLVKEGYHRDTWRKFMLTCVECGGCNFICDTCHCFLLADKKEGALNSRLRLWDSCQYANFSRVAGGANPLRTRTQRLRNRFLKKFDFFVENLGIPACCGCGRCIEVCPGKIDIREVLKDLTKSQE